MQDTVKFYRGTGGASEAGIEGAESRIPKVVGNARNKGKLHNIVQLKMPKS